MIVYCNACSRDISSEATTCPHCGQPDPYTLADAHLAVAIQQSAERQSDRETYILIGSMCVGVLWGWAQAGGLGAFLGFAAGSLVGAVIIRVVSVIDEFFGWEIPVAIFWHFPRFIVWRFPHAIYSAIADRSRQPIRDDELYMTIVTVLRLMCESATPAVFDEAMKALPQYLSERLKVDGKRLSADQGAYVSRVRDRCASDAPRVRGILDQLIPAFDEPSVPRVLALLRELDAVFRPLDGGDGADVYVRAAEAS